MSHLDPATVEAAIERALTPLKRLLPARTLEKIREEMREYATTHPYPAALLRQIGPEPIVKSSHVRDGEAAGDEGIDGVGAPPAIVPLRRIKGTGGGGQ
jgi:hypothetical protein